MRQSQRKRAVNKRTTDKYKKALRDFRKLVSAGNQPRADEAQKAMSKATSMIDKAVKKNQVHRNKAARLKSRMAKALGKLGK